MISLAILDKVKDRLLRVTDDGEAMTLLGSYLETVRNPDSTIPRSQSSGPNLYSDPSSEVHVYEFTGFDSIHVVLILNECDDCRIFHFWQYQ